MDKLLNYLGTAAGLLGILVCAASGLARVAGSYHLWGYEAPTLFSAGTGLMVFACLLKLETLAKRNPGE